MSKIKIATRLSVIGLVCASTAARGAPGEPPLVPTMVRWTNPLVKQRADPQISYVDGDYYLAATVPEYDRLELRRAPTLDELHDAEPKVIWRKHDTGPMGSHIWAPELHRIDGKWYVYFAAGGAEDVWAIRTYILENSSADPFEGQWVEKGELKTKWESFTLDSTTFVNRGVRYLVWAQKDPAIRGNTNLYIAKMDTPWSIVQPQVMISKPDLPWEQIGYWVNEGPAVLIRNGRVFIAYSASATDFNYCMGMLTANDDANLLDPKSWTKSQRPVFATWTVTGQYGPGHNSFTTTPDGRVDLLVYHARQYRDIQGDPLHDPNRHTRVQVLRWNKDGTPYFGVPVADGLVSVLTMDFPVYIPRRQKPAAPCVEVIGAVIAPDWVLIPPDRTLTASEAVTAVGGPTPNASRYGVLTRTQPDGKITRINFEIHTVRSDPSKDIELQDGDVIHIGESVLTGPWKE